jgi:hypothetical protein
MKSLEESTFNGSIYMSCDGDIVLFSSCLPIIDPCIHLIMLCNARFQHAVFYDNINDRRDYHGAFVDHTRLFSFLVGAGDQYYAIVSRN